MKKKDPAFLFYSTDFYEGTRMMLLEERATFIDLLIYQHQHQFIPNDFKRVALYCTGSNESIVKAVLEAKFKLCDNGWQNLKLAGVVDERKLFSNRQSVNGTVGQFFKKSIKILSKKDYTKLKEIFENQSVEEIYLTIKDKEINEAMLQAMLIAKHKHLEDEIKDEDRIKDLIIVEEHKLNLFISEKFTKVSKLKKMTNDECDFIITTYPHNAIVETLGAMENKKDLLTKYSSCYLTLWGWLKRRKNDTEPVDNSKASQNLGVGQRVSEFFNNQDNNQDAIQ